MAEKSAPATTAETSTKEPFEVRRWRSRSVRVFAAMDTMPQIAERALAIVGEDRVMNKVATYVHPGGLKDLSGLEHATGLVKGGHAAYPDGHQVWQHDDQAGFSVYLTHGHGTLGTLEGFGASVLRHNAETEQQVRARHDKAAQPGADPIFDRRRDLAYLELHGQPGEPHRDDRIEVMDWNEHGVLRHTIVTFVEPDYCDSGRLEETHYLVLGYRKDPTATRSFRSEEEAEVLARFAPNPGDEDPDAVALRAATEALESVKRWDDIDFAWLATEKITRERRSVR